MLKIAEKGTIFCFTLEKVEKSAFFLPPRSEICRHLRRVVPTAYRPKFRFFWGPEKSKILHFFWHLRDPEISCPDKDFQKSGLLRKVAKSRDFVSGQRFQQVTYGSLWDAKNSTFRTFSRFLRFSGFLWFFRISQDFEISGLLRTCPESTTFGTSELDFWGPKKFKISDIPDISFGHGIQCRHGLEIGVICTYFFVFFVCKKNEKIYLFGLNHLSNCWLLNAVGSLRPIQFQHV